MTTPAVTPDEAYQWDRDTADYTVRECPTCGEYDRPDYEPDQSCPLCERTGETL